MGEGPPPGAAVGRPPAGRSVHPLPRRARRTGRLPTVAGSRASIPPSGRRAARNSSAGKEFHFPPPGFTMGPVQAVERERAGAPGASRISVIVPTLDEAANIDPLLKSILETAERARRD